ncbi:hypothetical protein JD844_022365 [Phrynosoma platyrhinos]|uniref:Agouti signaling protein n=1 Tax=Phrynosoma platyrhinos TaxID=52577 RepID=A0ABQ7SV24_PHRPL|nr:hypothetical protein JD844_022365 [Phrynosoma platyrhinos]
MDFVSSLVELLLLLLYTYPPYLCLSLSEYNAKLRDIRKSIKSPHPPLHRQRSFSFSGLF